MLVEQQAGCNETNPSVRERPREYRTKSTLNKTIVVTAALKSPAGDVLLLLAVVIDGGTAQPVLLMSVACAGAGASRLAPMNTS